ncbi:glycosyltransferase family A protein [Porticoccus sp. W117]|uniref:glycosyltransferase family 2 protein n=1 Tax=Porticoccus sp. W117 TaxID=3054777 RepID=UPI0025989484|nr:glycosyltransferase family A protein [Porticoccus sp. W117]MDM3870608.1 glycosyltransferase family A protein [Porticoccus sp. W117]
MNTPNALGFVAIGRNEGERLKNSLLAMRKYAVNSPIVYVDSGSDDGSVAFALSLGVLVVELDTSIPFTAARARNAGFEKLLSAFPELEFVQFMDGDCELEPGWIEYALAEFSRSTDMAIASGRRSEKNQDVSVYNRLMDVEWNTAIGEAKAVLGDMMVKVDIFREVGGFSDEIIAAEDDDFCIRTRAQGYKVYRLDCPMSRHDANILRIRQWYKRAVRGGYGFANIWHLHGRGPEKYFFREVLSALFWGALIPLLLLSSLFLSPFFTLCVLFLYGISIGKMLLGNLRKKLGFRTTFVYGFLILTAKISEFAGMANYMVGQLSRRRQELIEYK